MGQVLQFKPRAEVPRSTYTSKLTGLLPPIVAKPPRAMHRDPFVVVATAILTIGFLPLIAAEVWFSEGWRYR